ncbi:Flavodoxin-1 [Leclercia adecarboxylata]|uniref:Flavodoxin-1 n=1 Tax=Leclercia adecarboxylata TaxID=83655 RepID=A0A4U9HM23_9ENTR|nr:Flavodoxin-1 [Leclercia adecarboxylata]
MCMTLRKAAKKISKGYDILLLGIPTWYYGEAQCDWDDFFRLWKRSTSTANWVALFGCGDQEDYAEYFCDALGTIRDIIEPRGAVIVGHWPTAGYHFEASKGLADDNNFVGLAIDEDRQPELTAERVDKWVKQNSRRAASRRHSECLNDIAAQHYSCAASIGKTNQNNCYKF